MLLLQEWRFSLLQRKKLLSKNHDCSLSSTLARAGKVTIKIHLLPQIYHQKNLSQKIMELIRSISLLKLQLTLVNLRAIQHASSKFSQWRQLADCPIAPTELDCREPYSYRSRRLETTIKPAYLQMLPWLMTACIYPCVVGPDFWGLVNRDWRMCTAGQMQSPVNIDPAQLLFDPHLGQISIDDAHVSWKWFKFNLTTEVIACIYD